MNVETLIIRELEDGEQPGPREVFLQGTRDQVNEMRSQIERQQEKLAALEKQRELEYPLNRAGRRMRKRRKA